MQLERGHNGLPKGTQSDSHIVIRNVNEFLKGKLINEEYFKNAFLHTNYKSIF